MCARRGGDIIKCCVRASEYRVYCFDFATLGEIERYQQQSLFGVYVRTLLSRPSWAQFAAPFDIISTLWFVLRRFSSAAQEWCHSLVFLRIVRVSVSWSARKNYTHTPGWVMIVVLREEIGWHKMIQSLRRWSVEFSHVRAPRQILVSPKIKLLPTWNVAKNWASAKFVVVMCVLNYASLAVEIVFLCS